MRLDSLNIEILEDGTIKVSSDRVSQANHMMAEAFLRYISEMAGGGTVRQRKGHHHTHAHEGHHHHDHAEKKGHRERWP
jgi:hypothetical protein